MMLYKTPELKDYGLTKNQVNYIRNDKKIRRVNDIYNIGLGRIFFISIIISIFLDFFIYLLLGWIPNKIVYLLIWLVSSVLLTCLIEYFNMTILVRVIAGTKHHYINDDVKERYSNYLLDSFEYQREFIPLSSDEIVFNEGNIQIIKKMRYYHFETQIICNQSIELYNQYKAYYVPSKVKIEVARENGTFHFVDNNKLSMLLELMNAQIIKEEKERRLQEEVEKKKYLDAKQQFYSSKNEYQFSLHNQLQIINEIKLLNIEYLNYLIEHQDDDWQIIKYQEQKIYRNSNIYQETSYIFTLNAGDRLVLVFENKTTNRASIICTAEDYLEYFENANLVFEYLTGDTLCKRELLRKTQKIGNLQIKSINHDDINSWKKEMINFHAIKRSTDQYKSRKRYWYRKKKKYNCNKRWY